MSKGSNPRPFQVPREEFRNNWDKIFGNKKSPADKPKDPDKKDAKYNDNKG